MSWCCTCRPLVLAALLFAAGGCSACSVGLEALWVFNGLTPAAYAQNLKVLQEEVLPEGWKLSPVLKWNAYGHDLEAFAGVVAGQGLPMCVIDNDEMAVASKALPGSAKKFWRIMPNFGPAGYGAVKGALDQGYDVVELLSPKNLPDVLAAAKATGKPVPVHIYLFTHYGRHWGFDFTSPDQLRSLVASLDPKLVQVKGIMTHTALVAAIYPQIVQDFFKVACPVALELAARGPIALHYAGTSDLNRLAPTARGRRIVPDAGACTHPNITWHARLGRATFMGLGDRAGLQPGGGTPVVEPLLRPFGMRR